MRGAIKKSVHFARKKLNYTALNFIFSNGKFLWALREVNINNVMVKKYKMLSYYSLYKKKVVKNNYQYIISSEKIDKSNKWKSFKNHQLLEINLSNRKSKIFNI